jgi:hypothetical protein
MDHILRYMSLSLYSHIVFVWDRSVYPKVSVLSHDEINNNKHSLRSNTKGMAAKLTRLTHKIAIQLHLVAESCSICSSRSRRPVRKLLDTSSCILIVSYCLRLSLTSGILWLNFVCASYVPHACYKSRPLELSRCDHSDNLRRVCVCVCV